MSQGTAQELFCCHCSSFLNKHYGFSHC